MSALPDTVLLTICFGRRDVGGKDWHDPHSGERSRLTCHLKSKLDGIMCPFTHLRLAMDRVVDRIDRLSVRLLHVDFQLFASAAMHAAFAGLVIVVIRPLQPRQTWRTRPAVARSR